VRLRKLPVATRTGRDSAISRHKGPRSRGRRPPRRHRPRYALAAAAARRTRPAYGAHMNASVHSSALGVPCECVHTDANRFVILIFHRRPSLACRGSRPFHKAMGCPPTRSVSSLPPGLPAISHDQGLPPSHSPSHSPCFMRPRQSLETGAMTAASTPDSQTPT
jgi:hypothetical protein